MTTYNLSNSGRTVSFSRWINNMKGCGLPNNTNAFQELGPQSKWDDEFPTLGQIADACPFTGRVLARFALEHLGNDLMVKGESYE